MPIFFLLLAALGLGFAADVQASPAKKPPPLPPGPKPPPPPPALKGAAMLDGLTPEARAFVVLVAERAAAEGIALRLLSGKRSCAQQNALYAQGRTAPGPIVTGARGCMSWHVQGAAVDFEPTPRTEAAYARVGAIATELGGRWGGTFPNLRDIGHIEYHPGKRIEDVCPDPDKCLPLASPSPVRLRFGRAGPAVRCAVRLRRSPAPRV